MYDQQLWYWPEKNAMVCLSIYMDGSYQLQSEDLTEQECIQLFENCLEQTMDAEDFLDVHGLVFLDHIPVLQLTN